MLLGIQVLPPLRRRLTIERAVFLAACMWLLAMGLRYQAAPVVDKWGAQRTSVPMPGDVFVHLGSPAPEGEYIGFGRSPFCDAPEEHISSAFDCPIDGEASGDADRSEGRGDTGLCGSSEDAPVDMVLHDRRNPYDLPIDLVGRVQVGGRDGRTIFMAREDGTYLAVREGDKLPGLGVRIVRLSKSVVIVENEQGARFQLTYRRGE